MKSLGKRGARLNNTGDIRGNAQRALFASRLLTATPRRHLNQSAAILIAVMSRWRTQRDFDSK
jgi:hypothetical protein